MLLLFVLVVPLAFGYVQQRFSLAKEDVPLRPLTFFYPTSLPPGFPYIPRFVSHISVTYLPINTTESFKIYVDLNAKKIRVRGKNVEYLFDAKKGEVVSISPIESFSRHKTTLMKSGDKNIDKIVSRKEYEDQGVKCLRIPLLLLSQESSVTSQESKVMFSASGVLIDYFPAVFKFLDADVDIMVTALGKRRYQGLKWTSDVMDIIVEASDFIPVVTRDDFAMDDEVKRLCQE